MKKQSLIHIKFDYDSALECKKDMLASEIDLLRISQRVKKYREMRILELDIKEKIESKLKSVKLDIGRLQNLLPKIEIPPILKPAKQKIEKIAPEEPIFEEEEKEESSEVSSLDQELLEIQRRLEALQ